MAKDSIKIINQNIKNGQTKCVKCGASDVYYDKKKNKIICNYCASEFDIPKIKDKKKSENLEGEVRGSATKDIDNNASNLVTIKCDGCGAEIIVNTTENLNTRCHWCGSSLSVNHQVDNGIVPDEILPFQISREQALTNMMNYAKDKLTYTTNDFKNGLILGNIHGVYFPYLIFDAKAHGSFKGVGEKTTRTIHVDDDTYYDADVFRIERDFDITVEGLTIESNSNRLDKFNIKQKNNVINAIMPFDTNNCIQFNANYLDGFTSEKRDIDIDEIEAKVKSEVNDIARKKLNESVVFCDRGVRWEYEGMDYQGKQWLSAYLPVWLYSYQDKNGVLHYIAVNGRTGETVGSIPLDKGKLATTISIIAAVTLVLSFIFLFLFFPLSFLFLITGFCTGMILFIVEDYKYANLVWKRHHYEAETKCDISYTNSINEKFDERHRTSSHAVSNVNNHKIHGDFVPIQKK